MATSAARTARSSTVNHTEARNVLDTLWQELIEATEPYPDDDDSQKILRVLRDGGATYPFILITQLLGKAVNSQVCALAMQATATCNGAWDARSLCSSVVYKWQASHGPLIRSGNDDPYVNQPARWPTLHEMEAKAKKKSLADILVKLCTAADHDPNDAKRFLRLSLWALKHIAESSTRHYPGPARAAVSDVLITIDKFLGDRSQGVRLQAVCLALLRLFNNSYRYYEDVKFRKVNAADIATNAVADIECTQQGQVVFAAEVKDREVSLEHVELVIAKARAQEVENIIFLVRAANVFADPEARERAYREFSRGISVNAVEAKQFIETTLLLLPEARRAEVLKVIYEVLKELRVPLVHIECWAQLLRKL